MLVMLKTCMSPRVSLGDGVFSGSGSRDNMQSLRWPAILAGLGQITTLPCLVCSDWAPPHHMHSSCCTGSPSRPTPRSSPGRARASTGERPPNAGLGPNHLRCTAAAQSCPDQPSPLPPEEPVPEAVSHPECTGPRGAHAATSAVHSSRNRPAVGGGIHPRADGGSASPPWPGPDCEHSPISRYSLMFPPQSTKQGTTESPCPVPS
jgi:hypothetical protein